METISNKYWNKIFNTLDENQKRWFAAQKSIEIGYGGVTQVRKLINMSRTTITKGIKELKYEDALKTKIRKEGGGRKSIKVTNENIIKELELIMDENTAGDPMSSLKWTCKSTRNIAEELNKKGYKVSYHTVYNLLTEAEYTLQGNKKTIGKYSNQERDAQFRYINFTVKKFIANNEPIISVDTKKKELVGNFKNNGQTWRKKGQSKLVNDHDFCSLGKGIAIPYGAYDIQKNEGFVNIGITADTAEFAVNSIRQWWQLIGKKNYPNAKKLLICADGGGSNGSRSKIWKLNLQKFTDETGLNITVCHYPPGTSKWNKIEHKMFSFISMNWKGIPLESYEMIINLIGGTKTSKGLRIKAKLDTKEYEKGIKISEEEFDRINIYLHKQYPKWNYSIKERNINN